MGETKVTAVRKDGEKIIATLTGGHEVAASKQVVGVTAKQLMEIEGLDGIISPGRLAAIRASKPISLFKCFLDFKEPWWRKHGFLHGKSTTDTDVRQIHYYDENDLLIYVSDGDGGNVGLDHASRWNTEMTTDRTAALHRMFEIVKKVHMDVGVPEEDISEPDWEVRALLLGGWVAQMEEGSRCKRMY